MHIDLTRNEVKTKCFKLALFFTRNIYGSYYIATLCMFSLNIAKYKNEIKNVSYFTNTI